MSEDATRKAEDEIKREQTLGLYIVGLLAVIAAWRFSAKLDPVEELYFNGMIGLWGIYAFLMVFAYSNIPRVLGRPKFKLIYEKFSAFLKDLAQYHLILSLVISAIFYLWYYWFLFVFWSSILGFASLIILIWYYRKIRKLRKETESIMREAEEQMKKAERLKKELQDTNKKIEETKGDIERLKEANKQIDEIKKRLEETKT